MKKQAVLIIITVLSANLVRAQICPDGDLQLSSQSEVDQFATDYAGCTEISGHLEIAGDDITDLSSLSSLVTVGGDLLIEDNNTLTSLTGLHNITSVGADLDIVNNESLTNLSGLDKVTEIGGDLTIEDNPVLTSLTGLENVTTIGEDLDIIGNDLLTSLAELSSLNSIGQQLTIEDNSSLTACALPSTCEAQSSGGGQASINGNGTGCADQAELAEACITSLFIPDFFELSSETVLSYNPLTSKISIISHPEDCGTAGIYTHSGRFLIQIGIHNGHGEADLSGIQDMAYLIQLRIGNRLYVRKMIKQ
jgi:hypothetical protein